MRGNIKVSSRYCENCESLLKFEKNSVVLGFGDFVMTIITVGVWIIFLLVLDFLLNPWRCSVCGER